MPFDITLGFVAETERDAFVERVLPRVRGRQIDPAASEGEDDKLHRVGVSVTSPSAAKDLLHQVVAFLAHAKKDRVQVRWSGQDGQPHVGDISADSARDAELLAVRVSAAAKARLDAEKS